MQSPDWEPPDSSRVMTLYGQMMTRTGSIFAVGMLAIVPFGLVSLAVTTRFLSPDDFGKLAVLFTAASTLTVLGGLGVMHGTLMSVYGLGDDGEGDADGLDGMYLDDETPVETPGESSDERRRLLGSGLLVVTGTSTALCVPIAVGALVARPLIGAFWAGAIAAMTASALAGSVWRLVIQVPRMERTPVRWGVLQYVRPALVLAATVVALVAGFGITGVLMGTAVGTAIAVVVSVLSAWRCYRFQPRRQDLRQLWDKGKPWVPLTLAAVVQSNVNVILLAILANPASVGLYQVASRIAQIPTYFADGFLTGWPAMEHSPISFAAKDRKGRRPYSATVFTLFCLLTLALLLFVSMFSGLLIHIAAPSYDSAATLIPVIAAAFGANAVFRGIYRATSFPLRRYWFMLLHLIWLIPYAGVAALVIPLNASYGVAIAQLAAGMTVSLIFVMVDRRSNHSTPFEWRRLGMTLLVAIVCVTAVQIAPVSQAAESALALLALAAFAGLLVRLGVIKKDQLSAVRAIATSILPRRIDRTDLRDRLALLPNMEREAVVSVVCKGRQPEVVASDLGATPELVSARMVRGLRRIAGGGPATPIDHLIGTYVLHPGTTIERDSWATHLRAMGVDPLQLHMLDESIRVISRLGS